MNKATLFLILVFLSILLGPHTQSLAKSRGLLDKEAVEYRLRGYIAMQNKNYEEAIQYLQKACFLDPYYAGPHNDLGLIYEIKGWWEKAEREYLKAVSIDPNFAEAVMNLGLFYESRGLLDKAVVYFQKRIEIGPPDSPWVKKAQAKLLKYVPNLYKEFSQKEEARNLMYQAVEEKYKAKMPGAEISLAEKTISVAQKLPAGKAKEPEFIVDEQLENYLRLERDLLNPQLKNWFFGLSRDMIKILYGKPAEKKIAGGWHVKEITDAEWFNAWLRAIPFSTDFAKGIYKQDGKDLVREKWIYKIPAKYKEYALKPQIVLIFENNELTGWEK